MPTYFFEPQREASQKTIEAFPESEEVSLETNLGKTFRSPNEYCDRLGRLALEVANRISAERKVDTQFEIEPLDIKKRSSGFKLIDRNAFSRALAEYESDSKGEITSDIENTTGTALVVQIRKTGPCMYPFIQHTKSGSDLFREIADQLRAEAPVIGTKEELVTSLQKRDKRVRGVKIAVPVVGLACSVAGGAMIFQQRNRLMQQEALAAFDSKVSISAPLIQSGHWQSLRRSITIKDAQLLESELQNSDITIRKRALEALSHWATLELREPRYLGKTDETYSGPVFFERILTKALEHETDPQQKVRLLLAAQNVREKGYPVIVQELQGYAAKSRSQKLLTTQQAKAVAWEHFIVSERVLHDSRYPLTKKKEIAEDLGVVMFESTRAIPKIGSELSVTIIPKFDTINQKEVKDIVIEWGRRCIAESIR